MCKKRVVRQRWGRRRDMLEQRIAKSKNVSLWFGISNKKAA